VGKASAPLVGTITKSGTEGSDGWITVALGGLLALFGYMVFTRQLVAKAGPLVIALGAGAFGLYELSDMNDRVDEAESASSLVTASVGVGLWMVLGGAAVAAVAALAYVSRRRA
jgi:hypothetical protein